VITASWDHTIKIWDLEMGGMKSELVGNKSFFDISYSPLSRTALTASADRTIRLYDPRSKEGVIVRSQYTSHDGWVTCVDWCRQEQG
jgi:ribosome biogenesis protein YTM1